MSEPFLGEIRIVGFNFAPRGWAKCDGAILPINQNQSLYALLGTAYSGDGRTSFGLPDLRGRAPMHVGPTHNQGERGGVETVRLSTAEMPTHTHSAHGTTADGITTTPTDALLGQTLNQYRAHDPGETVTMHSGTLASTGSGLTHDNMQPWLALNFCIAIQGLFPSRN